jgi:hypothetical protein
MSSKSKTVKASTLWKTLKDKDQETVKGGASGPVQIFNPLPGIGRGWW